MFKGDQAIYVNNAVASRIFENEAVIVIPETGTINVLNEVGTRIWELLQSGPISTNELTSVIANEYSASRETIIADVIEFVNQLEENGIVSPG